MVKAQSLSHFDDGNEDNIKVTDLDDNGNIIIDKDSAVGILEEFKKNHKDVTVTATFFVNGGIFNQSEYNEKILKWMVENGYDIGNHTQTHLDIKNQLLKEYKKKQPMYMTNQKKQFLINM